MSLRRALRKPPRVLARRLMDEVSVELERVRGPRRSRRLDDQALLSATRASSIADLWRSVLSRPYPFVRTPAQVAEIEVRWPEERTRILAAAEKALRHEIDLLGTGPVLLGSPIEWNRDWKTGRSWPLDFGRRMSYAELDRPSDVKVPWEISRLQWLLPAGLAYCLTGEDRYAAEARDVIDDWLAANPYGRGVNWALAMEAALRIFTWTWLLYACGQSAAWSDPAFRSRLLRGLYLHGDFVARNLERGEVNGNHYTADAASLVVAGLVLDRREWADDGWAILCTELPRQVHADGVDFESSSSYHRLVGELFALPALLRKAHGLAVPAPYIERLVAMGRFTDAYTGADGLSPFWGDADNGRALPLGGQDVSDHRSLPVLAAALVGESAPGNAEAEWIVGTDFVSEDRPPMSPAAFPDAGVFIMRGEADLVFVDCGPVGLRGRGGHGHNDCLSFEATLAGVRLVRDSGTYVYTASPQWRNLFRSTAFHSTPEIDGAEQNRIDPSHLWSLHGDATPDVRAFDGRRFQGSHAGYLRLTHPVTPVRTIELDVETHSLFVRDEFEGEGEHTVAVPLQLAPGVTAVAASPGVVTLGAGRSAFRVVWSDPAEWKFEIGSGWVSPSYGVKVDAARLRWTREGALRTLQFRIEPM